MLQPMSSRQRRIERAHRRARAQLVACGADVKRHRETAGLTLEDVGDASGTSGSAVSRFELGLLKDVSLARLAAIADAVGLESRLALYPTGAPVRDAAHAKLLQRLRARLHPSLRWRTEIPLELPGDFRAWDAVIGAGTEWVPVEAETRLADLQALERRINLKLRDGGAQHLILLVADSRNNRDALRAAPEAWTAAYSGGTRAALQGLGAGRLPERSALIVL